MLLLGLSRFIRVPDPPKELTGSDLKPANLTTLADRRRVFITKNRFWRVGFWFSSLKTRKTRTGLKISKFRPKIPESSKKT